MHISEILTRNLTLRSRFMNYWSGRMAGRSLSKEMKEIDEDMQLLHDDIAHYNIEGIEKHQLEIIKDLAKANVHAHKYFTVITVKGDDYIKLLRDFNTRFQNHLKLMVNKKKIDKKTAEKYAKYARNGTEAVIKLADDQIRSEYKDAMNVVAGATKGTRQHLYDIYKETFKVEKASWGKYFLMRMNIKNVNKDYKKSKETMNAVYKDVLHVVKAKPENVPKLLKELRKNIQVFFKETKKGFVEMYKGIKRDLLIRYLMQEDSAELVKLNHDLIDHEVIPPMMGAQTIESLKKAASEAKVFAKEEATVLIKQEHNLQRVN